MPFAIPQQPSANAPQAEWARYFLAIQAAISTVAAPNDARFWVSTANVDLTNEQDLGSLASGYLKITTAAATATPSTVTAIPGGDVTGAALTAANDTNVTLTLGGTPLTSLLRATSLTMGWTGTLAAARLNSNVVQSVVNDTNVTGSIAAQALTLAWAGLLGLARGGTNADLSATGGASQVLRQSGAGADVTVSQLALSDISGAGTTQTAYGAGTAYALTDTPAALDFGTTDPSIVIAAAGTYLLFGQVLLAYNGATVVAETATLKMRRTNNTAADVGQVVVIDLPVATTLTHSYGIVSLPPTVYTTANTDDALTIFGNVSAALGAGTIDATAVGTSIVALRIV